jgi:opacity protein-like surface antigen
MAGRPYIGGGFLYGIEEFTGDNADLSWDNTWGLFLKGGYFVTENIAVEGLYRFHNEWTATEGLEGVDADISASANDLTVNGKFCFPMEQIMPYVVAGAGYIQWKAEADIKGYDGGDYDDTESGPLARAGAGCDYFFDDNIGIEVEATYNMGFQDVDDLNFIDIMAGIIVAF